MKDWPPPTHEPASSPPGRPPRRPLLRIDPAQRRRLEEIRDNLRDRIAEAEREGWTGEAEGARVSLDAATSKLAQADLTAARRAEAVNLGIPAYRDIAATTLTTPVDPLPPDDLTAAPARAPTIDPISPSRLTGR